MEKPTYEELTQENLRMREALNFYETPFNWHVAHEIDCPERDCAHKDKGERARNVFQSIPHTDRLAKQREADLKCIDYLKTRHSHKVSGCIPCKLIAERERAYGEKNENS